MNTAIISIKIEFDGEKCGPCEMLVYGDLQPYDRAWMCLAFQRRVSGRFPAGCTAEKQNAADRTRVWRCDECRQATGDCDVL